MKTELNQIELDKIHTAKNNISFYQSTINRLYDDVEQIIGGESDYLFDALLNDFGTIEEALEKEGVTLPYQKRTFSLKNIVEHDDGSADYTFDTSDEFDEWVKEELGISELNEKVLGLFIKDLIMWHVEESEEIEF